MRKYRFAAVILLIVQCWLELSTLEVTTPTFDEPHHIMRGYAYVARGEDRYIMYGPVLSDALSGIFLLLEPDLQLPPPDDPVWTQIASAEHPDAFIWSNAVPPQRIVFLGRLPIIAVSLVLGAFIFRWASERSGALPASGALLLYVFCPNLLAHARLATTDAVTAAAFLISAYTFHRALDAPRLTIRLSAGAALGLALAAKFSAVVLPLAFVIESAVRALRDRNERRVSAVPLITLAMVFTVGALTLWALYRFKIGPIESGGIALPAPYYWREWQALNEYLKHPLLGYLFGEMSSQGWWYYYPVAFLVKTPLPVLIILVLSVARTVHSRAFMRDLSLILAPGLYLGALLFSPHDLGYRYLLPVLPAIFVYSADIIAAARSARASQIGIGLLLAWQVWGTLRIYPYYLTFFNELVGSPDRGRYILSDSNIDWGQDLIGLKRYVDQQHIERIKLSYFGTARPDYYGLEAEPLPPVTKATQDPDGAWRLRRYYPPDPPPGVYAISATYLMTQDIYAGFRGRTPDAIIGGSIYVYTVPARGAPTDLALGSLQIDHIDPNAHARFNTNDLRLRWFRPSHSLIAPPNQSWIAMVDQRLAPELAAFFDGVTPQFQARSAPRDEPYSVYYFDLGQRLLSAARNSEKIVQFGADPYPQPTHATRATLPVKFGDSVELIGYQILTNSQSSEASVITYWRALNTVTAPTELFVHALNSEAQIVAQRDEFGAAAFGWHAGDLFVQVSRLAIPAEAGPVWIEMGLYNPNSGERLPLLVHGQRVGDRLLLKHIEAP